MSRIKTVEARSAVGGRVRVSGWLQSIRRLGGLAFLVVRDGWGTIQAVAETPEELTALEGLMPESVVSITGHVVENAKAPGGSELHALEIEVVSRVEEPSPIQLGKKERLEASLPTFLDHAPIAYRHPSERATFKLGAAAMAGFRETLEARGFTEVQTPKLVASATESGANVFAIDYFGRSAFLAQSPQLYKQLMVGVFERVFEVAPVFRAEPHDTHRHLSEYVSLDVELGFVEDHFTVMALLREVLVGIFAAMRSRAPSELETLRLELPKVPETIPHLHFTEAQALVLERTGRNISNEPDLAPEDERELGQWAKETHQSDFLFVTGYPMKKRPFYTHPDPERPEHSRSFDLLFRGTELVTGGQRLHRWSDYLEALARWKLTIEPFESYLEAFRFGMPPHGGFAIGLERLLMQLTGASNIRRVTLFPRDLRRLTP
jgi:nondiscriminating aspartyl-tRNA synthetase